MTTVRQRVPATPFRILCVVGARPNFIKAAPFLRALEANRGMSSAALVHTGQHFDDAMSGSFFRDLGIRPPDVDLEVGSGSHAAQTAQIMQRFEPVLLGMTPDCVVVFGDVNSTLACALVAAKHGTRIAHVEAGLRSRDWTMPEEINRTLTDRLSDRLYTTEATARDNLIMEGIAADRIAFVGNIMIDSLLWGLPRAVPAAETITSARLPPLFRDPARGYGVLTLHRPSNVDDLDALRALMRLLGELSTELPLVFPVHPRTRDRISQAGIAETGSIALVPPLGYFEMLGLVASARLVLTDSGGLQEETTVLGVPCLTLRDNTERPVTITQGTNTLVGRDEAKIRQGFARALARDRAPSRPEKWDGRTAERIVDDMQHWLHARNC